MLPSKFWSNAASGAPLHLGHSWPLGAHGDPVPERAIKLKMAVALPQMPMHCFDHLISTLSRMASPAPEFEDVHW